MSKETAEYEIKLKQDSVENGLRSLETKMDSFETKVKGVGSTLGAVFAADRIFDFGGESIKTAAKVEALRNSIVFASGSAEEGAENLQFLEDISRKLGFQLLSTTEGFKTFSGALIGSKFEGEQAREIFTKISYGISAMGLSADDAKGAFLALGQMVSKGTVSAEELRGQLGERLPGAFQIAARSLGVTTQKLGEMLKAGEVITEDFLPRFADEMEKTFIGGVEKASQGLTANLNRIENKIFAFTDAVGGTFKPIIKLLGSETKTANDEFGLLRDKLDKVSSLLGPLTSQYDQLKSKTSLNKDEQFKLKSVINDIAELMPTAVTAWDEYGNAIDISTEKLGKHIKFSQDALKVKNAEAIKETERLIKEQEVEALRLQNTLNKIQSSGVFSGTKIDNLDEKGMKSYEDFLSAARGRLEIARHEIDAAKDRLSALKGEDIDADKKNPPPKTVVKPDDKSKGEGGGRTHSGVRNVTINIGVIKLAETINSYKADLSDVRIQEQLKRAIVTSANDANMLSN